MKYANNLLSIAIASCISAIALPSIAQIPNPSQNPAPAQNPAPVQNSAPIQTPAATTNTIPSGFLCDTTGDVPTTVYQSGQGDSEPWIKWVSDHFSGSGWSPDTRCQEVSSRLETYRRNKKLRYVTLGTVNNQSVICVASKDQGPCEGIIYTLKPGQDGVQALNNLFAWRKGGEGLESNYESATAIPYINVGTKLDEVKTEQSNVEPATQAQPQPAQVPNTNPAQTAPETHREL